ncbi:hypothetical protein V6N11_053831 [Hibiscus sabdariffa]|uniref:NAC domain-containing protein n=1 Tax=Hibiscus sabdariffa TaxID=183260 RepID=A0ABR2S295_9ROSI
MEMEGGFVSSLPAGYRFKPRDEELVDFYLKRKIYNKPLPPNIFRDVDLYNYDPYVLTEMSDNASSNGVVTEWYFFTKRNRRHPNDKRPVRSAGDGYWKATGVTKPVLSKGEEIGLKRSLVLFRGKSPKGEKTDWLMHEYLLTKAPPPQRLSNQNMQLDDWVLCRVYTKKEQRLKHGTAIQGSCNKIQDEVEVQALENEILSLVQYQEEVVVQVPPLQPQFPDVNQIQPQQRQPFSGISAPLQYQGPDAMSIPQQQQVPLQLQFSGVDESQLPQQRQFSEIPLLDQYQELDADVFNMLIPQQQQFSDVNQSQPLQQQQFPESEISPLDQFLLSLGF